MVGPGTLTLSNQSNSFTGGVTVNGGTLNLGSVGGGILGTGTVTVNSGGNFTFNNGGGSSGELLSGTNNVSVILNSGTLSNFDDASRTIGGNFTITGTSTLSTAVTSGGNTTKPQYANLSIGNAQLIITDNSPSSDINASYTVGPIFTGTTTFTGSPTFLLISGSVPTNNRFNTYLQPGSLNDGGIGPDHLLYRHGGERGIWNYLANDST